MGILHVCHIVLAVDFLVCDFRCVKGQQSVYYN